MDIAHFVYPITSCTFGLFPVLGHYEESCSEHLKICLGMNIFFFFSNFMYLYLLIYLFMAVLGLRFCVRAFSSCGKWGPFFIVVHGPLIIVASLVAEHRLQTRRLSNCGSRA